MGQEIIDLSGRRGLATRFSGDLGQSSSSPELRYLANPGEMVEGVYNPLRKYGYLSPTPNTFTTVSESTGSSFTDEFRAVAYDSDLSSLYVGENGSLLWGASTGDLTDFDNVQTISGSAIRVTDMEVYQINGSKRLFVAHQKAGGGEIMEITMGSAGAFSSVNANWLSTDVTGAFNTGANTDVFMRTSDNGFMYIFDTNVIHKLDGTTSGGSTGTVTTNAVVFPAEINLVDAVDWRGYLWIAMQSVPLSDYINGVSNFITGASRITGIYVWDRQSTVASSIEFIPLFGVREIRKLYVTSSGEMRALVVSAQQRLQIRRYNGYTFDVIRELGSSALPIYRDSVGYLGDLVIWYGYDGKIYAHGSIGPGEPEGVYILADTSGLVGASAFHGAISVIDSSGSGNEPRIGVLFSAENSPGTTRYNRYLYLTADGATPNQGNVYSPVKFLPEMSTVNNIVVYCAPTQNATTQSIANVKVYFNQSTTPFKTYNVTEELANRGYINIECSKPFVNSVQLEVEWDTNNPIGSDDFLPSMAVVNYKSTTDKG